MSNKVATNKFRTQILIFNIWKFWRMFECKYGKIKLICPSGKLKNFPINLRVRYGTNNN